MLIPPAFVKSLFRAAAALYRTDPWKRFRPSHLFGIRVGKDSDWSSKKQPFPCFQFIGADTIQRVGCMDSGGGFDGEEKKRSVGGDPEGRVDRCLNRDCCWYRGRRCLLVLLLPFQRTVRIMGLKFTGDRSSVGFHP